MNNTLGQTPTSAERGKRDAFHVPYCVSASRYNLKPGMNVKFVHTDSTATVVPCEPEERHGIADPFLRSEDGVIPPGYYVYVLLDPTKVRGLTHVYEIEGMEDPTPDDYEYYDECRGCDS